MSDAKSIQRNETQYEHNTKGRCYYGVLCFDDFEINPLTPELNSSPQSCLTRFFTGDFAS
jgi:hypothetical protein